MHLSLSVISGRSMNKLPMKNNKLKFLKIMILKRIKVSRSSTA